MIWQLQAATTDNHGACEACKEIGPLSVRLDPDVRQGIEALATTDGRSLSDYINRALRQHVEAEAARRKERGR